MARTQIYVGLEIGTSKTCMVVAEGRPDGTARISGVGVVPSAGVEKGEITRPSLARQCVRDALAKAQDESNVDIVNVYLSVTGDHIRGETNIGSYRLPEDESIIDEDCAAMAREKAEEIDLASDRYVINRECSGYSIDGRSPTPLPEGLSGRTIDVSCHVIHGIKTRLQNSLQCVMDVPLEVRYMVFAPLATAKTVLKSAQRESGALVLDIGGGTTDYICYKNDEVIACGCIPAGGKTINADICRLSERPMTMDAAEVLKCREGNACGDTEDQTYAYYRTETGLHDTSIRRGELHRIIKLRLRDILARVYKEIPAELFRTKGIEVYLSGGTSMMRGLPDLVRQLYRIDVHVCSQPIEKGESGYSNDPRFFTAIGLIRYAQVHEDDLRSREPKPFWIEWLSKLFSHRR